MKFLISRTDNIGDVVLTLPLCGFLKEKFGSEIHIVFLGKSYTKPVVLHSPHVDEFLNWDDFSHKSAEEISRDIAAHKFTHVVHVFPNRKIAQACRMANISTRIGTRRRWFHLFTCNKLPSVSRKNSELHESQLNTELVCKVFQWSVPSLNSLREYAVLKSVPQKEMLTKLSSFPQLKEEIVKTAKLSKLILLHPKSFGSAREWGIENFKNLATALAQQGFYVGITGSEKERDYILTQWNFQEENVFLLAGLFSLSEFISLIQNVRGLVAASTGPLHIAAACGVHALGLYPPMRPIHPARWMPLGKKAHVLVENKECSKCKISEDCDCLRSITVNKVVQEVEKW
jgi:heptosyltransferase III